MPLATDRDTRDYGLTAEIGVDQCSSVRGAESKGKNNEIQSEACQVTTLERVTRDLIPFRSVNAGGSLL